MGIHTVRMAFMAFMAPLLLRLVLPDDGVGATALEEIDAAAQIDDLAGIGHFGEECLFEVNQPHVENELRFVEGGELPGRRLEGFGTGPGGYQYLDGKILSDDSLDDVAQREDGYVDDLGVCCRPGRTRCECDCGGKE